MRRGVFRLAIVVSLPLFVATVALWVESYGKAMAVSAFNRASRTGVAVTRGELLVYRQLYLDQQGPPQWVRWEWFVGRAVEMDVYLLPGTTPHFGFFYGERGTRVYPTRQLLVPMWAVAMVFGAAPVTWVMLALRRKREPGVCFKCGYDLTGNESGVCPECGREIVMRWNEGAGLG